MSRFWNRYQNLLILLAAALSVTVVLSNLDLDWLEAHFYDFRVVYTPAPKASPDIALIAVDDTSAKELNEFAPLPLDQHTRLIEILEKSSPRAVGYLVNLVHVHQLHPELFTENWGERFVSAANRMEMKGVPVIVGSPFEVSGEVISPFPLNSLQHSAAIIHKDGNVFSEDKVTRRALYTLFRKPTFHLALAESTGRVAPGTQPPGSIELPEVEGSQFFFRYHGSPAIYPGKMNESPYPTYSMSEILSGKVGEKELKGKIILVGTLFRENPDDFTKTPYSRKSFVNPKLLVHAQILDSVINGQSVQKVSRWVTLLLTFVCIALVLSRVLSSSPVNGVFTLFGFSVLLILGSHLIFYMFGSSVGYWFEESYPIAGIFIAYYLAVPLRLTREYSKRWEYQRRNELLTQVEELKTNFLSLVTHDLKTPVARIQGLAEVLLRKAVDRLIDRDRESLQHIIESTDELNRFISSILELTKIESSRNQINKPQIKLETKDINQLVERCVESFKAPARARGIKLHLELEPLFPIRIDPSLMAKVINNLIDNAIRYSPSQSQVHISTKENGRYVEISVADQGVGMTVQEQEHLFTKFYRAKNELTSKNTGTGLGLYLTKYFVEAHRGQVKVESEIGKGSVFTIVLPQFEEEIQKVEEKKPFLSGLPVKLHKGLGKWLSKGESNV